MSYTVQNTPLDGVRILQPELFSDKRGFFFESYNATSFERAVGFKRDFVQDNHSRSVKGVLRGLHYQIRHPQGKLVRVIQGAVFDVAVDMRRSSPTFGKWAGVTLSAENQLQLWIPEGFAHGFYVLSDTAEFLYKATEYYHPECERTVMWNDATINISWPVQAGPVVAAKDAAGVNWSEAEKYP